MVSVTWFVQSSIFFLPSFLQLCETWWHTGSHNISQTRTVKISLPLIKILPCVEKLRWQQNSPFNMTVWNSKAIKCGEVGSGTVKLTFCTLCCSSYLWHASTCSNVCGSAARTEYNECRMWFPGSLEHRYISAQERKEWNRLNETAYMQDNGEFGFESLRVTAWLLFLLFPTCKTTFFVTLSSFSLWAAINNGLCDLKQEKKENKNLGISGKFGDSLWFPAYINSWTSFSTFCKEKLYCSLGWFMEIWISREAPELHPMMQGKRSGSTYKLWHLLYTSSLVASNTQSLWTYRAKGCSPLFS